MNKIILASKSYARQTMLRNAGVEFDSIPANIDEEKIQNDGGQPVDIAEILAKQKAVYVSQDNKDFYVIGSDQVLSMNDKIYSKAKNKTQAQERLKEFSGQAHLLHSSVSVVKNSEILFTHTETATLKMKNLSDVALDEYTANAGDVLTQCVGCYAIEGLGVRLFEEIKGDFFTIMGMPLLPLLNFLEGEGAL